jgi:hypothetical protein
MRRFFLALGVRCQHVARSLPDIPEAVEPPADGLIRGPYARVPLQLPLQQRDRPRGVRVAELLGRARQQRPQGGFGLLEQLRGAAAVKAVGQGRRVGLAGEGGGPVVDALAGHPEHRGDVGGRAPAVEFQHGESPSIGPGVVGRLEL